MEASVKKNVINYLGSHSYMRLATVCFDGKPLAHTVGYASEGTTVYFATDKRTRKFANISKNPDVAYTIDEDYRDINKIQGIQMEGKAAILSAKADIDRAGAILEKKFAGMPDLPEGLELVLIKVEPTDGYFLDYTQGFAHMDRITF